MCKAIYFAAIFVVHYQYFVAVIFLVSPWFTWLNMSKALPDLSRVKAAIPDFPFGNLGILQIILESIID